MGGDFFFVIGIVLVAAAVLLAFIGIRGTDRFPPNRAVMVALTALFAAGVVTTMAFAIVKSNDEQDERNAKLAEEEKGAEPAANPGGQPQASGGGNQQAPQPAGAAESVDVTSPADGGLSYQPSGLEAKPGSLAITYTNPSPVPHSIAVATANGNVLGEVQPFTNGKQTVDVSNLAPGKYVFYCTVPGHREAGMQGNLTVGG
ncbi:MAG: plastocyanin/azurin family copper-binding protein [Solirubrobacterales bacterium]